MDKVDEIYRETRATQLILLILLRPVGRMLRSTSNITDKNRPKDTKFKLLSAVSSTCIKYAGLMPSLKKEVLIKTLSKGSR